MPSVKWFVEPVFLCREPLPPDKNLNELDSVSNLTLVTLIKQLSNLSLLSNCLFEDITNECQIINERAQHLLKRLDKCKSVVSSFNAKTVKIEITPITESENVKNHFKLNRKISSNLFTPNNRAQFIQEAYQQAGRSPLNSLISSDNNQKESLNAFKLSAAVASFSFDQVDFLDIERQKPEIFANAPKLPPDQIVERTKSPVSQVNLINDNCENKIEIYALPSPKERTQILAQEYPSSFVPIDVTGATFQRMHSFRRSLIHRDSFIKRKKVSACSTDKKRRNTVCENVNHIKSVDYQNRRKSDPLLNKIDESCQTEENFEEIYKNGRIIQLDSNQITQVGNKCQLKVEVHREDEKSDILETISDKSSPSLFSNKKVSNYGSLKIEKPKKRKCEFNTLGVEVKMREPSVSKGAGDDGRSSSGNWSASSSTHASVDSDPNTQTSISGLNQMSEPLLSASNSSIGKDSVMSEGITNHGDIEPSYSKKVINSYNVNQSLSSTTVHSSNKSSVNDELKKETNETAGQAVRRSNSKSNNVRFANRDSECWAKYFDGSSETITPESGSGSDNDAKTPKSASAFGQDCAFNHIDDEEESVYSVDNDGYYTSMHTDSGLFKDRMGVKLLITPNSSFRTKSKRNSISSVSTIGDISINSILSKTDSDSSSGLSRIESGPKIPPCPPVRISSIMSCKENSNKPDNISRNLSSPTSSNFESDQSDTKQQLKIKTTIDSTRYPSLCNITSSESSLRSSSSESKKSEKKRKLINSYKTFKDIFNLTNFSKKSKVKPKTELKSSSYNNYDDISDKVTGHLSLQNSPSYSNSKLFFSSIVSPKQDNLKSDLNHFHLTLKKSNLNDDSPKDSTKPLTYLTRKLSSSSQFTSFSSQLQSKSQSSEQKRHSTSESLTINLPYHLNHEPLQVAITSEEDDKVFNCNLLERRRYSDHTMNCQNVNFDDNRTKCHENKFSTLPFVNKPSNSSLLTLSSSTKGGNLADNSDLAMSEKKNDKAANLTHTKLTPMFPKPEFSSYRKIFLNDWPKQNILSSRDNQENTLLQQTSPRSTEKLQSSFVSKKSLLTTDDLLTLIQSSKKKLSTRSDTSSSPPSTLNSPTSNSSTPSTLSPGDRRSWSYSREFTHSPIDNTIGSRRSLALDRLGPTKATTISDFKKLLAQARPNTNTQRKSAAEILQISNPSKKRSSPPPILHSSKLLTSSSQALVRDTRTRIINGRAYRSSYRLETMYPPIQEVGSEESLKKSSSELNKSNSEASKNDKTKITLNPKSTSTWV